MVLDVVVTVGVVRAGVLRLAHLDVLARRRVRHGILSVVLHLGPRLDLLLRIGHLRWNVLLLTGRRCRAEFKVVIECSQRAELFISRAHDGLARRTLQLLRMHVDSLRRMSEDDGR